MGHPLICNAGICTLCTQNGLITSYDAFGSRPEQCAQTPRPQGTSARDMERLVAHYLPKLSLATHHIVCGRCRRCYAHELVHDGGKEARTIERAN